VRCNNAATGVWSCNNTELVSALQQYCHSFVALQQYCNSDVKLQRTATVVWSCINTATGVLHRNNNNLAVL
jgi:hypothetical protein